MRSIIRNLFTALTVITVSTVMASEGFAQQQVPIAEAESLYIKGHPEKARRLLEPYVRNGNTDFRVMQLYGFTLIAAQDYKGAEETFLNLRNRDSSQAAVWIGLGMAYRATLQFSKSEAAYRQAVRLDPNNSDAQSALEFVQWERKNEIALMGGFSRNSTQKGGDWQLNAALRPTYKWTVAAGVARFALQDISPVLGGITPSSGGETQLSAGAAFRPNDRITVSSTFLHRSIAGEQSIMLWPEAVIRAYDRISLVAGIRAARDGFADEWVSASDLGIAVQLPHRQGLTVRIMHSFKPSLESPATIIANYEARPVARLRTQAGMAYSNGTQYESVSFWGSASFMIASNIGVKAEYSQRTKTFKRNRVGAGLTYAW